MTEAANAHNLKCPIEVEGHKDDINYFLEHSKISQKGDTLKMTQADTAKWFESKGWNREDLERFKATIEDADIAMASSAMALGEKLIKDKIEAGEDAANVVAHFKMGTTAFEHDARMIASQSVSAGMAKAGEEVARTTRYGRLRCGMEIRGELPAFLAEGSAATCKKALGLA